MKKYLGDGIEAEVIEEGVILINKYLAGISIVITPDIWENLKEFMESSKELNENSKSNA